MQNCRRFFSIGWFFLIVCFSVNLIQAAAGDIDPSFNAYDARTNGSNLPNLSLKTSLLQPDGKILIAGSFTVVGSHARKGIARLNADGTVDTSFNPPEIDKEIIFPTNRTVGATIYSIGLQPDGKILISGDFTKVDGLSHVGLVRLNPDGSPDTAFNNALTQTLNQFEGIIYDIEILPDGKFLLGGDFSFLTQNFGRIVAGLVRFHADGTYDSSFANTLNGGAGMDVRKIRLLADGRMMVSGTGSITFNNVGLARLHADGAIDFSFSGVGVRSGPSQLWLGTVIDFEILSNGQIVLVGNFTSVNGFTHGNIARVNSDGSVDLNFNSNNAGANSAVNQIELDANEKLVIAGGFTTYNSAAKPKLARINPDGTTDNTFNYTEFNDGVINTLLIVPDGRKLIGGEVGNWNRISIVNPDGSPPPVNNLIGMSGLISSLVLQADGKILIGGRFETANGVKRSNLARFNPDGTLDAGFDPMNLLVDLFQIHRLTTQADGKILLATAPANFLIRLNPDGTRDTGFTAAASGTQEDVAVQADGKIILVGDFRPSGASTNRSIVRFNANGTLDNSFNSITPNGLITRVVIQPDGKILIAGWFNQISGNNRGYIARLNTDGTLDNTFNPPGGANAPIQDLALQPDGKIVVAGEFTALNGSNTRKYVGRLNGDGSLDPNFAQEANAPLLAVGLQPDGKILIGGTMTAVAGSPKSGIARLNANGSLDSGFQVGSGTNNPVRTIGVQADGKILAGGEFSEYRGVSKISLVRLLNSATPLRTNFDYDGDGKADFSVFRPATSRWYELLSSNSSVVEATFGTNGDLIAPADCDGDGKTDLAIFRPSTGSWWYLSSLSNTQISVQWGQAGDIPRPSDFDGDGRADFIVYRPSNSFWYRLGTTGQISNLGFGIAEDKPVTGDFDGDGKSDFAVFRPSTGTWWYAASGAGNQFRAVQWGLSTDVPVPADYDGDGKTDFAVWRPSNGGWYIINSSNGSFTILGFGLAEDKPVPADYDGDGRTDLAVFRPSNGIWYLWQSTLGFGGVQWGLASDVPTPHAFIP